jgi:hypothetical protein
MLAPVAHVPPGQVGGCLRDRAADFPQAPEEVFRQVPAEGDQLVPAEGGQLVPVAAFQLGREVVSQLDPVGVSRLGREVVSRLVPAAAFQMALIRGVVSLPRTE